MYKLRIVQSGKEYDYEPGASLLEILLAQNIFIDNPCNGKGVCGKCKVRIVSGEVGEVSSTELRFLKPEEVNSGVRLSCMVHPQCDLDRGKVSDLPRSCLSSFPSWHGGR